MKAILGKYLFPLLMASLILTGCAENIQGQPADMKKRIDEELGAIERITVLSTDGVEVPLELTAFLKELPEQGKDLQKSDQPLAQDDIRYTLVLYRAKLAPLVVEIGEQASQFGGDTYRGQGAVRFYQWIHRLAGAGLLSGSYRSVVLSAVDLNQTITLDKEQTAVFQEAFLAAEPLMEKNWQQYPLYPYYQMRVDTGERMLEATLLTPTLIAIPFGRETQYYRVPGALFSNFTQWMPPRKMTDRAFQQLFQASAIRLIGTGDQQQGAIEQKPTETTVEQGMAHQSVRLLQNSIELDQEPKNPGQEKYQLSFAVGEALHTVYLYDRHFRYQGKWFAQDQLEEKILRLLGTKK
ncbi:hypothetical protein KDJ56_09450 [Brevibacillus composti]|uniref:Uncharacterized protein n=1 Tax=Brevibacillus composti TaxID=2796470 RepID=A0A7T5EP11_9BACL|nr:hypothetical protein [Brevibacillus composti]QQE76116.1 hypothetical protein JD108_09755 [Brevibacillus composti]QUO43145.1 hypothetical protein KDJ56_09450 [Brevibacillus composti]